MAINTFPCHTYTLSIPALFSTWPTRMAVILGDESMINRRYNPLNSIEIRSIGYILSESKHKWFVWIFNKCFTADLHCNHTETYRFFPSQLSFFACRVVSNGCVFFPSCQFIEKCCVTPFILFLCDFTLLLDINLLFGDSRMRWRTLSHTLCIESHI